MSKKETSLVMDLADLKQDAPVNTVLSNFMKPSGPELELLTRTTPQLARAAEVCFLYGTQIKMEDGTMGSPAVRDLWGLIMRMSVSMDGLGRKEQIEALQAGGKLPDSYFNNGSSSFEVRE